MGFPETVIPHFASDRQVAGFFGGALKAEWIDEIHEMKPGATRDSPYARRLKEALHHLLSERPVLDVTAGARAGAFCGGSGQSFCRRSAASRRTDSCLQKAKRT